MKKTYIPSTPRSRKLKSVGSGTINVSGGSAQNVPVIEGHTHDNKIILDAITQLHLRILSSLNVDEDGALIVELSNIIKELDTTVPTDENLFSALRTVLEIKARSISKTDPDTAQEIITFLKGIIASGTSRFDNIEVGNYATGPLGAGAAIKMENGVSRLEVDNLDVRMRATFRELIIESLKHIGGQLILSPARMKCTSVVDGGTYYKCYFDTGDGKVSNEFVAGDQARCQVFTGSGVKMYWRLVTSVGTDWINLSKTDAISGSSIPEAGDDIVQLGNRTDTTRQNAQILSTVGSDAPSWKQYKGINAFSLEGKDTTVFSGTGNKIDGKTVFMSSGANVEDGINSKNSNYSSQPTSYKANDTWTLSADTTVNGIAYKSGDILTATQDSTAFVQAHWVKKVRYTDDSAVNNLEIGGRNYILNSLNRIGFLPNTSTTPIEDQSVAGMDYRRFRRAYPEGVTSSEIATYTTEFFTPEKSGNYIYSTYFRPNDFDIELRVRFGSTYGEYTLCKAGEWTRVSVVAFINKGQNTRLFGVWGDMPQESVQWIDYNRVSVVSGNKPTDWTPAPEDTKAAIDAAVVKATYWSVKASAPVIYKDAINAATAGTHTPVTVSGELRSGTTTTSGGFITVTPSGGTEAGTASASPVTIAPANGDGKTSYTVKLYDTASKTTLLDTMTIPVVFKGASGVNAINVVLSNEADVLPASTDGTVSDYAGSGTTIRVFEGAAELDYDGIGTANGKFNVTASATGITAGAKSESGLTCVFANASNMTADNATITFTIAGKTADGASFSLTKTQSFAKSRTGQKGDTGASAPLLYLSASAQVMKCNPDNTPQAGQTISIEAKLQNVSGTATFVATPYNDAGTALTAITLGGSGNTRTLTNSLWLAAYKKIEVVATLGSLTDKVTIYRVADGATGKGISGTEIKYQVGASGTTAPTGTWITSVPTVPEGQFLWTRTITSYTDSTTTTSYSVSKQGVSGAAGKGISSTVITYQAGSSGTVVPTGTWSGTIPSVSENQYLWTRTVITYTDSSTSTSYSVGKMGAKGDKGDQGLQGIQGEKGADGITYYTWVRYADTPTTGMSQYPTGKSYIGFAYNKTTATESSNYADYKWSLIKGEQGIPGDKGADGTQYYTWIKYADTPTTGMSDSPTGKAYIGIAVNKTTATESTNYADYTWQLTKGDAGQNAIVGLLTNESVTLQANNAGIVSSFAPANGEFWVYNGVTKVTSGITFSKVSETGCTAAITSSGAYSVSAMSADNATVVLRAVYSGVTIDKVLTISKSRAGADGVSITDVDVEFAKNTSSTTAPTTGWTTTAPTLLDSEQLWTRTKTAYSSGNPTYSTPANITPQKGDTGAVGQGVESVTEEYAISTSKTVQPTSGWSTTQPTWVQGQYIWSRVKVVYKNPTSTIYTGYAVSSEWEAVNNLEIGGRNLLKNTNRRIEHSNYLMESFYLGDVKPQTGERVTIAFKGELSLNKTFWQLFVNGTVSQESNLTVSDKGADGVWRKTFTWNAGSSGNTYLNIYSAPGAQSGISWIEDVMLVFGNKIAYYSKAPEDVQAAIDAEKNRINDILSDNVADPSEKQYLSNLWQEIYAEYPRIWAQANTYAVDKSNYEEKYTALNNLLSPVLANLTVNSTVDGASIRTEFSQYYDARIFLQNAITNKVNSNASEARLTAEQAQLAADGYMRARYVRDWIKGSTANLTNHWNEIKVINKAGANLAAGKLATSNGTFNVSNPISNITDNDITTFAHIANTVSTAQYAQIDLGQIYYDIDYIQIWHYYSDGRTYYGTKTEISVDGVNWTPVFDSAKSGTYKETAAGNIISFRPNEVLAKVLKGAAITDTFKTTINGGLISTVITEYRELNSEQVTGLISGIQGANKNLPFLVAGGTYAEGIAGTAKAIIRHDGSVKFTEAEVEGEVTAIEGKIGDISIINGALTSNYSYFTYIGAVYVQVTVIMNLSQSGLTLTSSYGGTADHPQVVTWTCEIGHTFIKVGSMEMRRDGIYRDGTKIL